MKLPERLILFSLILSNFIFWKMVQPQDYDFEIPEDESSAQLEFSGNLDAKWGILRMNPSSPFYRLQFFDQEKPNDYLSQFRLDFYLNGDYRYKQVGFTMRTFAEYTKEEPIDLSFFELYGSLNLSNRLTFSIGKRRYNWGKGYAFNPAGYVNAEKDPENPDLALAGKSSIYLNYNQSFSSTPIQNLSLAGIILLPETELLDKYSEFDAFSLAVKMYVLMNNIDLDFMFYSGPEQVSRYGLDFSTNLRENFEVHGEVSYANNESTYLIQDSLLQMEIRNGISYLLGLRYLNSLNITFIAEYYHNNGGLNRSEHINYLNFLRDNLNSMDTDLISFSKSVMTTGFRIKNLMQDYIYIKASLPEPFEWLYSSISIFTIYNVNDNSFILSPQIGYKPFTNSEILLWPSIFFGDDDSEYGNKQIQGKVEMWFRFYF